LSEPRIVVRIAKSEVRDEKAVLAPTPSFQSLGRQKLSDCHFLAMRPLSAYAAAFKTAPIRLRFCLMLA